MNKQPELGSNQVTTRINTIQTYLENSDRHITRYQELLKNDSQNSRWYQYELEKELEYKENLNYQLKVIQRLYGK